MIAEEGKAGRKIGERWSAILVPSPAASNIQEPHPLAKARTGTCRGLRAAHWQRLQPWRPTSNISRHIFEQRHNIRADAQGYRDLPKNPRQERIRQGSLPPQWP